MDLLFSIASVNSSVTISAAMVGLSPLVFIFQNKHIPPILKSGIACPIYIKGGKPADNPNSYRKITAHQS
jgi:hypothetical protein